MNDVHLHLIVNHIPILGTLFALALGTYGILRRQSDVVRAAFLALIVCGLFSIIALRTGEGAEEAVEHLPGFSEPALEAHEEAAEVANYGSIALAFLAVGALWLSRKQPDIGRIPAGIVLLGAGIAFVLMARAGNLGGEIRHSEIRDGTVNQYYDREEATSQRSNDQDDD